MIIPGTVLAEIHGLLEAAYPHEGCGLLIGESAQEVQVRYQRPTANRRERSAAARRYLITPQDVQAAGREAESAGMDILGVYHSHPDVAPEPSVFDREYAWPWYHYLIVSVVGGSAGHARAWQLADDRSGFVERIVHVVD